MRGRHTDESEMRDEHDESRKKMGEGEVALQRETERGVKTVSLSPKLNITYHNIDHLNIQSHLYR